METHAKGLCSGSNRRGWGMFQRRFSVDVPSPSTGRDRGGNVIFYCSNFLTVRGKTCYSSQDISLCRELQLRFQSLHPPAAHPVWDALIWAPGANKWSLPSPAAGCCWGQGCLIIELFFWVLRDGWLAYCTIMKATDQEKLLCWVIFASFKTRFLSLFLSVICFSYYWVASTLSFPCKR